MVDSRPYDVVLMDMQMPVMDGVAATRAIRSNPQFRDLPIIAMTANVMAADLEQCTEAGMNDHVAKPINPDELFAAMLRWIKPRDGAAHAASAATPPSAPPTSPTSLDSDALAIPGVDTKSALRRVGSNRKRYEALLTKFANTSKNPVDEIRTALAAGDIKTATRAAHSLKGAAANLGVATVAEAAALAETAINNGRPVEETLGSLSRALASVMAAIRSALPSESPATAGTEPSADPAMVLAPLNRLKTLLKNDDGDAADFMLDVRPGLSKVLTEAELTTLTELVGNFDFGAALNSLTDIAGRLSLKLE